MTKARSSETAGDAPSACASIPADTVSSAPFTPADSWSVASHEALYESPTEPRCDTCGCALPSEAEGDLPLAVGRGVYVFTRGSESRVEQAPLCTACASAIGMTALARWEIEEEEG